MKVVVIDYQLGNIGSVLNMLRKIGVEAICSHAADDICEADKLILPGVGAFDHGVRNLHEFGLIDVLNHEVLIKKKPILGICLGMQLLLNESEEGKLKGLGWLEGRCVKFSFKNDNEHLKIPHMGWNVVKGYKEGQEEVRFYFVHSYHAQCKNNTDVLGTAHYGYEFPAIIGSNHIIGAQFHPEKSHRYGMEFFKKFLTYDT